jgi:hypothetical protein
VKSDKGVQVLLRRGGVREGLFRIPDSMFVLFPTKYHATTDLLRRDDTRPYHTDSMAWDPSKADAIPIKSIARVSRWEPVHVQYDQMM